MLQTLGFFLVVLGTILLIIGLIGLNTPTFCPANSCSSDVLWRIYGPYWVSFYSGVALIMIGILLLVLARRVKFKSNQ